MAKTSIKSTKTKPQPSDKTETVSSNALQAETNKTRLPSVFQLSLQTVSILRREWRLFAGITALYGLLTVLLVQGFSVAGNISETKATFDQLFSDGLGQFTSSVGLFAYLLAMTGSGESATATMYQMLLGLIFSLALIWLFRQIYAGQKVLVRDGLYKGMTPLVQFFLVLIVVVAQLLPLAIGAMLYVTVTANSLAVTGFEQLLWAVLFFVLAITSLYLLASSLFALYIVTLPNMTPLQALRSARQLVSGRRWLVLRKILFLPVALVFLAALLVVPLILFATPLAAWVLFILTLALLPVVHGYMYTLYRSLI